MRTVPALFNAVRKLSSQRWIPASYWAGKPVVWPCKAIVSSWLLLDGDRERDGRNFLRIGNYLLRRRYRVCSRAFKVNLGCRQIRHRKHQHLDANSFALDNLELSQRSRYSSYISPY